jgi:hypothetical protein
VTPDRSSRFSHYTKFSLFAEIGPMRRPPCLEALAEMVRDRPTGQVESNVDEDGIDNLVAEKASASKAEVAAKSRATAASRGSRDQSRPVQNTTSPSCKWLAIRITGSFGEVGADDMLEDNSVVVAVGRHNENAVSGF